MDWHLETEDVYGHLTRKSAWTLAVKIAEMLDGIPMGQAIWIIRKIVPLVLKEGHVVNVNSERFKTMAVEVAEESPRAFVGSDE